MDLDGRSESAAGVRTEGAQMR
jgi:hypothetical protein